MAADPWDVLYGPEASVPDWSSNVTFEMPQSGDLLRWNPSLTGAGLQNLMDLGSIGRAVSGGPMPSSPAAPTVPNFALRPNLRNSPGVASLYGNTGTAPPTPSFWGSAGSGVMDFIKKNPAAFLAMLGAGGAGIAGAVKGSERAKLPGQVQDLVKRATAPAAPDAYEEAALDRQMRRDIGPGWETSTPGIQAKAQQQYLRQKGDRDAAAQAVGPVGSLYAYQDANRAKEQQSLFQLAALLGTLGLGAFGRS